MQPLNLEQYSAQSSPTSANTDENLAVEKRVIRQLLEALLFEQLCEFSYRVGYFYFTLGKTSYRAAGTISGFSRVRIDANDMRFCQKDEHQEKAAQKQNWRPIVLSKLINDLPTSEVVKQQLTIELEQTIKLCRWNNQFLTRLDNRRNLTYSQLESAIDEGHPYHPCFKARTGFSEQDHQLYGPEDGNHFQLHWLAIRRRYLKRRFTSVSEQTFWQQELGEECYQQLHQQLAEQTSDSTAFSLMPIHPWQWKNLQNKLAPALASQQLFYLGAAGDQYQSSISVRTLLNVTHPEKANIKLPLNIIITSSLRTIESHSFCTAPVLSNWLQQLVESDKYLQNKVALLTEYAGIRPTNDDAKSQPWINEIDGQLGVIFRQSIINYCDEKSALPFVALTVIEQDNKPFIAPWVTQYGCQSWLKQLLETVIIPIWHLLVHHGIALEAHGQNILLQHKQGWPEKIILRDFHESLEYVHDYLAQPELAPIFSELEDDYNFAKPNQYYWMTSVEALRELLVDTLFVFNLADLAVLLEKHYQYPEESFWQLVYQCFKDYQNTGITSQQRITEMNIFQPYIKTESLLDKKFRGNRETEFHHQIENPLAKAARQDSEIIQNSTALSSTPAVVRRTPCLQ
ncbi:IucA/IucC family protein [Aliikangiella sp. IMCC44359]|uniref:IucA/IucC family protein n=1 Tax=Aliikangiella sp. IMCC44359 TaxID=3459125 RepID=UPI00403AC779